MKASCRFFGKCSGCSLQQFPYIKQLHDKTKTVRHSLASILASPAELDSLILPTVPSPDEFAYRSSSKVCLAEDEMGRRRIGLYARASKKVIDIPGCPIHHPAINKIIERYFGSGSRLPAPFYQHHKRGFQSQRLKFLTIRFSEETQCFGMILSHTGVARETLIDWAKQLKWDNISLYESRLDKDDDDLVISRRVQHLAGDSVFRYGLDGRIYALDPMAFLQANGSLLRKFISHITDDLNGDYLLDLYGGFGSYSLAAASRFKKVRLVEANPHATKAASEAGLKYAPGKLSCNAIAVEDALKEMSSSGEISQVTHMIVNPPRSGLSEQVLNSLTRNSWSKLEKLHYVSCSLETLKRDLALLIRDGRFTLESACPFDMFPQTEHIELVVKLRYDAIRAKTNSSSKPQRNEDAGGRPGIVKGKFRPIQPRGAKGGSTPKNNCKPKRHQGRKMVARPSSPKKLPE